MSVRDDELDKLHELSQELMLRVAAMEELLIKKQVITLDEYKKIADEKTEKFVQFIKEEQVKSKIIQDKS
jgi:ABC-type Fe3+/spermidine/putrescine transport system ATPase subunit